MRRPGWRPGKRSGPVLVLHDEDGVTTVFGPYDSIAEAKREHGEDAWIVPIEEDKDNGD